MKRWIIRSFFIGLLLLCVGGWAWSVQDQAWIQYGYRGHYYAGGTYWGMAFVLYGGNTPAR